MVTEHVMHLNLEREEVMMIETVLISKTGELFTKLKLTMSLIQI